MREFVIKPVRSKETLMATLRGNWNYPTAVRFGPGRIAELADACKSLGMKRPLLVTDAALAKLPMIATAAGICQAAGLACEVFSDVQANPVESNVTNGVNAYRRGAHDGVIAFGGGSALDTGKAVALMVGQTRPIWDFEDREDWYTRVNVSGMAPTVAVPTTSGTGSEVGRASVITDVRDHIKKIIFHPKMLPAIVIADPELTLGLPAPVTAAVGMDALSHNLEAYCSPSYHPLAEGIALEGMRLVHDWLATAVKDGSDIEARSQMMAASLMGATAFQKGLGAMHSLSHPCSANLNTHHGLTNAVVMPYVLSWNRPALSEKMQRLAAYLNLRQHSFSGVLDWIVALRKDIGVPDTLSELGVKPEHAQAFAQQAFDDPSTGGNPIPVSVSDFAQLYRNCIEGRLPASA
ncbi:iron-containing alcohol dehydrogenase [Steroidobacter sp.]|uniref:iron-containing alcohol dehydrogenase n=1 Tax=Steroidobacter sp. TaxID=1978227 RepID=UPI001A59A945|nr:iron-containing alcohol dehydrogenase [Steroidobacter sp.]MBL8267417.1 iron-containing alcohol dehydrogenase [Steroidobacter sp.]